MLTDRQVQNLKPAQKPRKVSDGGGLHVFVSPSGGKLWRLAYRFNGKQKLLSFGPYPAVSLADARQKRDAAKATLAAGNDPSVVARIEKVQQAADADLTFNKVAEELFAKLEKEGRAEATLSKRRWFLSLLAPYIGNRPISQLTAAEILVPLRKVEANGNYETAKRLRAFAGQVCRYAIATARAENDPTFGLKGALISPKVRHMAALTDSNEFSKLVRAVWAYQGTPECRAALKLMVLLFPRPGELRKAEWTEFDFDNKVWMIPAERMKMRREHTKPLSDLAVLVLEDLKRLTGNRKLVFASPHHPENPISENTLNSALRRMGFTSDQATSHGFRASASSLLNESGLWDEDAIEVELAHLGNDEVRRAYHRARYWDERVKMADWWSQQIENRLNANG